MMNAYDMQIAASDAMRNAGMAPRDLRDILTDGSLCRFSCVDDSPYKKDGWAVIYADGPRPVCVYGHWRLGIKGKTILGDIGVLTPMEIAQVRMATEHAQRERERERERLQAKAKITAELIWSDAEREPAAHPYLLRKRIKPNGARLREASLVIAFRDNGGVLRTLQFINANGTKKFLSHGKLKGCFGWIGPNKAERILIAEGFATAASVHEGCGLPVAIAGHAGNLVPVAEALHRRYPKARLTIAGDNDDRGRCAAQEAATAVGGDVVLPPAEGADWNDWCTANGADALLEVLA